jgi:hypothetical protein
MSYSYLNSTWGDIHGLKASDLPVELLKKIKFEKLLECIEDDPRVPHVIAARILDEDVEKIKYLRHIPENTILKFPGIISVYNRFLEKKSKSIDKVYGRSHVVLWYMLNEQNKKVEIERWINKSNSIISENTIDYEWLYKVYPETADKLIEQIWKQENEYRWRQSGIKHMIRSVPEHRIKDVMERVFKSTNKDLHLAALGNPHLSEDHTAKALRVAAKRVNIPNIRATITRKVLESLPTITRLEVMEKLVMHKAKIKDIKDKDEFKMLFLGSIMRYPSRVEYVVNRFENIKDIYGAKE